MGRRMQIIPFCIHGALHPATPYPEASAAREKAWPCNACLFHKLLAHGLIPSAGANQGNRKHNLTLQSSSLFCPVESYLYRERARVPRSAEFPRNQFPFYLP